MNKAKLLGWVAALGLMFSATGLKAEEVDPYVLLSDVATKTFDRIKTSKSDIEANPEILRQIVEQELLPYVDYKFAALKVLGKHFKSVPRDKIPEFIQVFRGYLITTYAVAMGQYDNQTVVFEPARDVDEDKVVTVRALVKEEGRPDIKIAFKVRKSSNTDEWKAYDMVAEGISLLSSKQSELEAIIRQDGIDAVIALLKEKNDKPIVLKKNGQAEESAWVN
ncbi:ABC transporter substrate-binding protein [Aliiglaciecola sp. CAU 1673]|uniref:MlaC/ttg2D family ABC transporter substrate-binding protein n=1 Tax=Aliiglaciecola sp. CAU 1673 TaxID=3032595 RepID=UPI0023DA3A57|nr:ABC transporter substrate-binding protein [Aliiglaciecola sp. CAU 1673]MDF2178467.1 ABC transporter substrate-binding protein [Aliiglaciecola sp. CAU 1673]